MGVIEGGPKDLAAWNILEGGGDPPAQAHVAGVNRLGRAEARQRCAKGADQEDRLDHVAARLLDCERCKFAVIKRSLAHHPIGGQSKLPGDLSKRELRYVA